MCLFVNVDAVRVPYSLPLIVPYNNIHCTVAHTKIFCDKYIFNTLCGIHARLSAALSPKRTLDSMRRYMWYMLECLRLGACHACLAKGLINLKSMTTKRLSTPMWICIVVEFMQICCRFGKYKRIFPCHFAALLICNTFYLCRKCNVVYHFVIN